MDQATDAGALSGLETRFGGLWRVDREIEDFHGEQTGRFRGLARLRPEGDALRYEENGKLVLGASVSQARRVYHWRPLGAHMVAVHFEEGGYFHRFDWGATISEDAHECGEDSYAVRYSFTGASWRANWRVLGPRKDYELRSLYIRQI